MCIFALRKGKELPKEIGLGRLIGRRARGEYWWEVIMRGSGIYNHLCRGPVREKQQAKKESQPSILSLLTDFELKLCLYAKALS